ncbi:hypothetical protein HETIRDRAFT_114043 [Heterobasidion irregulare TC 32-1]|uniref:Uncharacterized protein n=1 Tax=Heterobasidion irregulare (strain TC 32-1) TaxID=747525 RepID=W4KNB2_HETIT|nr:uncharacterized protein HETIRDRAFT_114043 [Heterobasidion irregulare TC 32-1]ETW86546.1 hypothetical protein HETIRDRAFT_114043 [Heterobasidion irregulare TC 32-1]
MSEEVKMAVVEVELEKAVEIVNLVVKVIFGLRSIGGMWWSSGESIRAMRGAGDVDECEIEDEDGDDPPINASTGFKIWVPNADEIHFGRSKGAKETVEFKLGLGESQFMVAKGDGAESGIVLNPQIVERTLTEVEADHDFQSVEGLVIWVALTGDPNDTNHPQKCPNIGEIPARSPLHNRFYPRLVGQPSFIRAAVADNYDFGCAECCLVPRKCSSAVLHPLNHLIEALKVFPHKPSYAGVVGMRLEASIRKFVSGRWALNRNIINERNGGVWDLWLEDVGDVVVEDWD